MSFIYYVLIFLLYYAGPVYAGLEVEKEYEIVEEDVGPETEPFPEIERYAQAEVEVGELPSGKIKVFTDQTHNTSIVIDKQDCDIMRKKDDTIALGWKFGGLMWGFGPEIKIGHHSGVAWKGDVQRMVAEYQELCTQFNTGRLSQQEYQAEKQGIVKRGYNYARELEKQFRQKKDRMFKEMDKGRYISLQNSRFFSGCCYYPKHFVVVNHRAGSEYAFLDDVYRKTQRETRIWQRQQCRQNDYCNGRYVRRHHNYRRHLGLDFPNHRRYNNRYNHGHQNNKDWNWDVYGNSDGNWDLRVGKEW